MTTDTGPPVTDRRTVLKATAGAAATTLAFGSGVGVGAAQEAPGFDGWFDDVDNYDGVVDRRGEDAVTVEVGIEANGGPYGFGPAAVRVDPGTTIAFEWVSDNHNVLLEEGPGGSEWQGHEPLENSGFSYEETLETEGIYKYFCQPHLSLGMKGAVVVGDVEVGGGGDGGEVGEPDYGGWFDDVDNYSETVDRRGEDAVTVEVGVEANGGPYGFGPAAVRVDPGTTIAFEWVSDNHNVLLEEGPDGSEWQGHEPLENSGFSYEETLETEGVYKYFCQPHLSLGMKGAVVVGDVGGGGGGGDGDDGGGGDGEEDGGGATVTLPGDDVGAIIVGSALGLTGLGALAVLASDAYSGMRKRQHAEQAAIEAEYGDREFEPGASVEAPAEEPVEELGHDEYDPIGTAGLIVIYLLIVVLMWVFVYFVEFLGNGPTVIG